VFLANYSGIAGADGQDPSNRFAGVGQNVHAYNGVLFANSNIRVEDITDGTTNVIMVGEQSNFGRDMTGQKADCRSGGPHGAWIGTMKFKQEDLGDPYSNRVFNTTTIGRPLGTRACDYIAYYTPPYWVGVVTNMDNRAPILSAHPGGTHLLFADGSVHFLMEEIEFELFQLLAIRDSGEVKEWE
jgi:prepilin-type processing-associated H-X9-DG protein